MEFRTLWLARLGTVSGRKLALTAVVIATLGFAYYAARHPMDFRVYHYGARGVFDGTRPVYGPTSGLGWPHISGLLGGLTGSSARRERPYSAPILAGRFARLAPMTYLRTSVTTRLLERLRFLGRGTATEAIHSLTRRRTSSTRSASDFTGRTTLIILQAIECLLN